MFIIAQLVGIVGLILAIISFQKNNNKGILFFQVIASFTFTIHFILLGPMAYTGAILNLLGGVRNLIFFNRKKEWANKIIWLYLFIIAYIISGIITWQSIYSVLPIIAMVLSTIAFWIKNPKYTRFVVLPSSPCWLIYNIVSSSIAGILTELFVLSSLIIAIIRFDIMKMEK